MYCGRCGREIKDTAKFCPYCGNQVAVAPAAVSHPGTKNRKMLIIIGFGLVVIAAVMIGIMVKIYLGGKIENRIVGSWAPAVRDYNTGEYRVEKEMEKMEHFRKMELQAPMRFMTTGFTYMKLVDIPGENGFF